MKLATPPRHPIWRAAQPLLAAFLGLSLGSAESNGGSATETSPAHSSAVTRTSLPASYAPLPQAVTSFGATVWEGSLYVYGGHLGEQHEYSADMVSSSFLRLGIGGGLAWETLRSGPSAQGTTLVGHGGFIYRVGGMAARNAAGEKRDLHSLDSVARFDPASKEWVELPSLPVPRSSHDAVVVGDRLYAGGGWCLGGGTTGAKFHETLAVLDLAGRGGEWVSLPQPFQRRGLAMAAVQQKIYFIGGMGTDEQPSRAVDVFDIGTGQWSKGPELPDGPMKGFGASACSVGGDLYVSGMAGDVLKLNAAGASWEKIGTLRQPRFFHRLVPASSRQLLALGGTSRAGKLSSVEAFDLGSPQAAAATGWPQWRGARRDGISREDGWLTEWPKEGPTVLWKASLGHGLSSFAAADGRVYSLGNRSETDTIHCLDAETGSTIWTHAYPCASTNHAMSIVPGGPASTPTLDEDRLYTLSREGDLLCLDANSGRPVWERHLLRDLGGKRPVYGYSSSPLVLESIVLVDAGGTNTSTTALDKWTGKKVWAEGNMEAGYSSAVPLDTGSVPAVAMFKGEGLVILDSSSGHQLCQYPWQSRDFCNTATPVVDGTRVFVSSTNSEGGAMLDWKPDGMEVLWKKPDMAMLFNSCVLWEGHLYGFDESTRTSSKLKCLDGKTGETRWGVEEIDKGAFLMAGGKLVILTNRGELVVGAVSPQGFKLLARSQVLGGRCWAAPVLADGRAYCRNNDGEMVCLDLRKKS